MYSKVKESSSELLLGSILASKTLAKGGYGGEIVQGDFFHAVYYGRTRVSTLLSRACLGVRLRRVQLVRLHPTQTHRFNETRAFWAEALKRA